MPCSRVSPQSWTIPAGAENSNPQPRITSPTLYPLGHDKKKTKFEKHCLSSAVRNDFNSFSSSRARDFMTFTLHDLTDFYVERATAPHYNKLSFMFS